MAKADGGDLTTATRKYVEAELSRRLQHIERTLDCDVITCIHGIGPPFDDLIRDHIEDIKDRKARLLVILETDGGSIETAERIADVLRHHYPKEVCFLVPNFAMSAGTVLLMSGDKIYMDYYSILGPIDPQVRNRNGTFVPALGYLEKYEQLVKKSKSSGGLSAAELAFLVQKFDPAELHRFEQARDHSVDLLKKWLVQYKFKDWVKTRSKKKAVTAAMREKRAAEIANKLNDTKKWRSHGRGLSMEVIEKELNLIVENFGANSELNKAVRSYYRMLQDFLVSRNHSVAIQTRNRFLAI
ncbi:ATP-dependent Clp protease proteolytic subunit [Bradyrhizobium sp. 197]|uniref:SDH family Clp fold serine proteinase n=1 Tax=Bradyrhizobium sp. 197 TaxID=2782663 RepID=UPI001FF7AAFF|nr:ATP-dependent Clp protease proteolytic subunit [Bradyrhizobium sp. 197]MCK1475958.1 ATP-dependent Clp protease proteolytic subunit [Bradyrhizobium sp. 197]